MLRNLKDDVFGGDLVADLAQDRVDDVQAGADDGVELAEAFDHPFLALRHDAYAFPDQQRDRDEQYEHESSHGDSLCRCIRC